MGKNERHAGHLRVVPAQSLGCGNWVRNGDPTESGAPCWVLQLPAFFPVGLGDAHSRAGVGHAIRTPGCGPLEPSTGHPSACCQAVCSFRVAVYLAGITHFLVPPGMQTGPPRLTFSSTCTLRRGRSGSTFGCTSPVGAWQGGGYGQRPWARAHNPRASRDVPG